MMIFMVMSSMFSVLRLLTPNYQGCRYRLADVFP